MLMPSMDDTERLDAAFNEAYVQRIPVPDDLESVLPKESIHTFALN